jgi:hypothetical protein
MGDIELRHSDTGECINHALRFGLCPAAGIVGHARPVVLFGAKL